MVKNILIVLASIMVASANYEQSSSSNSRMLATETIDLFDNDAIEADYERLSGSSGMSGMNHHSKQMLGGMSSQGNYGMGSVQSNIQQSNSMSGSSGMSGMNHHSNLMDGGMSQGSYSSGSAQRHIQQSSQRRMSMPRTSQFKSASSGSQSKPTIGYLEPEFSEADNSNTVFIQHHGSAASNGMQNSGSASNYGMLNSGSASNYGMQNRGSGSSHGMHTSGSASNHGMPNSGSASNYGMQSHGSSGSNGVQNQGSSSNEMQGMSYGSSSNGMQGVRYESAGYY